MQRQLQSMELFTRIGAVALNVRIAICAVIICCVPANGLGMQEGNKKPEAAVKASTPRENSAPPDVAAPSPGAQKRASGVAVKVLKPGRDKNHPDGNDCTKVVFSSWRRDGTLVSTSKSMGDSQIQCLSSTMPGVAEVLKEMAVGEKRRIWVPAHLTHAHVAHHGEKKLQEADEPEHMDLTIDLELVEIIKAPQTPADLKVPPKDAVKTPSGLAFKVLKKGNGTVHPTMKSRVTLHFSCWRSDGKLYETTVMTGHPAAFLVGTAIQGWREGLPAMVVGEKRRLWVPAALAYGEKPASRMHPAGNLVYDIELLALQ